MMAERGISVSHTTIHRYVPEFEKRWNRFARTREYFLAH
jgi:transposase-like protein